MPTKYKDYPVYTYDEPATYSDFSGGINTDPSNEHLLNSEMRDCVNFTYLSGALVKRKGAKEICRISANENLFNIQGIFLYTYKITYIIVAADGKLFYGIYNEDTTIELSRLFIYNQETYNNKVFDETNPLTGIEENNSKDLPTKHDGFIQTFYKNILTGESFQQNTRGEWSDVIGGLVEVGDVFTHDNDGNMLQNSLMCIKEFEKICRYPNEHDSIYWESLGTSIEINGVTLTEANTTEEMLESGIVKWDRLNNEQWQSDVIVYYQGHFYKCILPHYNTYNALKNDEYFISLDKLSNYNMVKLSYLIFQNYKNITAATLNNKIYLATGTRIIEVFIDEDDLKAKPVAPYLCNYTEITKIGYNYMSPYPELAVASQKDTVTTSISGIKVEKLFTGKFRLTPVMNIQSGDNINNYYFRWEKNINGVWYTIITYHSQDARLVQQDETSYSINKEKKYSIEVDDADKYQYRCSFAKSFELSNTVVNEWDSSNDYSIGDYVSIGAHVYKCVSTHYANLTRYPSLDFSKEAYLGTEDAQGNITFQNNPTILWQEVYEIEMVPYVFETFNTVSTFVSSNSYSIGDELIYDGEIYTCIESHTSGESIDLTKFSKSQKEIINREDGTNGYIKTSYTYIYDYKVDKATGEYFGSAISVLFNNNLSINDTFNLIHSCTKIIADGNKLLFYDDKYNSGKWFKTIINNPGYITDRGSLSFKTNKNESIIAVVPFQGNLIVFANSENVGGSIHLVEGNGDDYDDESGYYSPYRRKTINASISCNNANTIQICDNILVFKYFNRVYYINASDLSNDVVKVTSCNDRVLSKSQDVEIPWDDNDCISEVTDTYYAIIWKEKYYLDSNNELILKHPGMRVKMYYKMSVQYNDRSYGLPWLRDESEYFNVDHIINIKGKPIFIYHNTLISFDEDTYEDLGKEVEIKFRPKAVDAEYPKLFKLINNVLIYYFRNQFSNVTFDTEIRNEAGHILLGKDENKFSIQDLKAFKAGEEEHDEERMRLDSTIQDTKVLTPSAMFPGLLFDVIIKAKNKGEFSLSSITFNYTSIDSPDTNPYDLYQGIIRPSILKK